MNGPQRVVKKPAGTRAVDTTPSRFTAFGMAAEAEPLAPGLHVVATPIGNLKDISFRALGTLAAAATVIAEDTRVTKTLLAHYGITTPLIAYHEHNAAEMRPKILARLKEGQALALVSDAGTPLVSDPGYKLVEAAIEAGIPVTAIPGPSAVLTALVVSGLPSDRFFFEGFLPAKSAARRARLAALADIPGTLIFFESPRRLVDMLADAAAVLGQREAAVARELTKLYENVRRDDLAGLAQFYVAEGPPRGEIVVLIAPRPEGAAAPITGASIDALIADMLTKHSLKEAVAVVTAETGLPRREVYARALLVAKRTEGK
jgi:16S rRNA (cytidine1402-2'-O)-methyltransferase